MPKETRVAVEWALKQDITINGITVNIKETGDLFTQLLVDTVRRYFNENNIEYNTYSFDDLEPYL